jgi:hypothetical protein
MVILGKIFPVTAYFTDESFKPILATDYVFPVSNQRFLFSPTPFGVRFRRYVKRETFLTIRLESLSS